MYSTIEGMKCFNKQKKILNSLQIFQKGILMSITSIKGLRNEMERKFGRNWILTHRTNQDCLENFFSQMRYRNGPNDHPSPVECIYNIKQIILGKNPGITKYLTTNTNTVEREIEEYASASLLKFLCDDEHKNTEQESGDEASSDSPNNYADNDDVPMPFLEEYFDFMPEYLDDFFDCDEEMKTEQNEEMETEQNEEMEMEQNEEMETEQKQEMKTEQKEESVEEDKCLTLELQIEFVERNAMEEDGLGNNVSISLYTFVL